MKKKQSFPFNTILMRPCGLKASMYIPGTHKPGALVRFPGSGTVYEVQPNGATLRRVS